MSYRNWCFTLHDVKVGKLLKTKEWLIDAKANYIIFQNEIAPTTGKEHLQGYVEFEDKITLSTVKKRMVTNSVHLEPRIGTQEQAITYCKKSETAIKDTLYEGGKPKRQGNRSDLDGIYEAIENRSTCKEILMEFKGNGVKNINLIEKSVNIFWGHCKIDEFINQVRLKTDEMIKNATFVPKSKKDTDDDFPEVSGNTNADCGKSNVWSSIFDDTTENSD